MSLVLKCLILGMLFAFAGMPSAMADTDYSDTDLQYLMARYEILRTSNLVNEKQLDFTIDCLKNPSQKKIPQLISWGSADGVLVTLDCARIRSHGAIALAEKNFPKMRQALILSQPSKRLFMVPDGGIVAESLDAELDLQVNFIPFHPYGLSVPTNFLRHIYDASLFQLADLPVITEHEKEFYRDLQNRYSRQFCQEYMANLAGYIANKKSTPAILENLIPASHPLLSDKNVCESFMLQRVSIYDRQDLSIREKKALNLLRQEYFKYSSQRRQEIRQQAHQEYLNLITASPLLMFMTSAHPSDQEWLEALEKVKANGDIRALVNLSEDDMQLVELLSQDLKSLSALAPDVKSKLGEALKDLLQNPYGQDQAFNVLQRKFPTLTEAHKESALRLQSEWDAEYALHRNIKMVVATGAAGICFIPAARMVGLATAVILKRGCMAVTGLPVNAYVFIHNTMMYERRLGMLLSTFDSSANIADLNLLNREKRAFVFASLLLPVGMQVEALGQTSQVLVKKLSHVH
ncbi:hypothetical protein AZI86_17740 [Bdellovibrio bacteriovorus]|uniref:Uncharacterized protein n=1 Tax=Bdellovibrio bacteriovorus TaxID=959 RepID=A0A150WEJ9_BDEBC|nr:hypothetical protein [Bdellovibrio bacteriovorus]KYG61548.1 hypothetical protein AZI86_17740 [Bdellovibrio bacteriovorus]